VSALQAGRAIGQPARAPPEKAGGIAGRGAEQKVVVTENGRRCKITVCEAVVTQLINKSATANLRATKMLVDLIKDAEKQTAAATAPEPSPRATAADEQVVEQLIERLRHQIRSEMAAAATNSHVPSSHFGLTGTPYNESVTVARRRVTRSALARTTMRSSTR
jgi:hypothetical protein